MSYNPQQIRDTVSYIISESFSDQSSKVQQFLETSLINIFTRLTKANPRESKFALDANDPVLFKSFFAWLEENSVPFSHNVRYVLKQNGESVADRGGDLTLIVKKQKDSSKKGSEQYNEMIEALRDYNLNGDEVSALGTSDFESEQDENDYDDEPEQEENNSLENETKEMEEPAGKKPGMICDELDEEDSMQMDSREEQKAQAALTFERSNRSKSSRALYFEAKKLAKEEKETARAKAKSERDSIGTHAEKGSAVRFENTKDSLVKTIPMLHAFPNFQTKRVHTAICSNEVRNDTLSTYRKRS